MKKKKNKEIWSWLLENSAYYRYEEAKTESPFGIWFKNGFGFLLLDNVVVVVVVVISYLICKQSLTHIFAVFLLQSLMWHIIYYMYIIYMYVRCHLNVLLITPYTEYNISVKLIYYDWYIVVCSPLYCIS